MQSMTPAVEDAPPIEDEARTGRRAWLQQAAALAAGAAATPLLPREAGAQTKSARYGGLLGQLGQQASWRSLEARLVRRSGFGITPADFSHARTLGYQAYLEEQLAWESIDDRGCDDHLAAAYATFFRLTIPQAIAFANANNSNFTVVSPAQRIAVERAILSKRQLLEQMVEFWRDHFNVYVWSAFSLQPWHERSVIRPHALGTVGALVRASMRSPAMLHYLDQPLNTRWGINENYARELMELHTVGVTGGYSQRDVYELARVLTGWTIDQTGAFQYRADNHDFGPKSVFGLEFPGASRGSGTQGMEEAIAFGEHLIRHPKTREYIATKLLKWFITPTPTEGQIRSVIDAYGTDGDIKAMLRVVLAPANVMRAPAKLKRPFHYIVSAVRTTGGTVRPVVDFARDNNGLGWAVGSLGHAPGGWQTPDGYPDRAEFWAGGIIERWNVIQWLIQDRSTGNGTVITDFSRFVGNGTVDGVVQQINAGMLGGEMSLALADELRAVLRSGVTTARIQTAVRLALMSPEFQFY